jgi:hypothetical protein
VALDASHEIAAALQRLVRDWRNGQWVLPVQEAVRQASRRGRSEALVGLLTQSSLSNMNR